MNRHFGALGDVWKHLALAELLRLRSPRRYWETHAGSASYQLTESPARLHGVLRFLARARMNVELERCAYLQILKSWPGVYLGSAAFAMRILEKRAKYILCDVDPESASTLRAAAHHLDADVVEADGVSTILRAMESNDLAPEEVFVHVDPFDPHARATPDGLTSVELAAQLIQRGFRVLYWYGYDTIDGRGWAKDAIAALAPGVGVWCGDVLMPASFVYPERSGAWGCGVVLANTTDKEVSKLAQLGSALESIGKDDEVDANDPPRLTFRVFIHT